MRSDFFNVKILAIDLGTHCGIACNMSGDDDVVAKTFHLATAKEVESWGQSRLTRRDDPRAHRLADILMTFSDADVVVFEDVEFSTYTKQTQLWSALRTAVWLAPWKPGVLKECVPVTTLKKFATGHGGATKEMMRAAFEKRFPGVLKKEVGHDAVDALWLWVWAKQNLSRL